MILTDSPSNGRSRPSWRPVGTPPRVGPNGKPLPRRARLHGLVAPFGAWSEPGAAQTDTGHRLAVSMRLQPGCFDDPQAWAATRLLLEHDPRQDYGGAGSELAFHAAADGLRFVATIDDAALIADLVWLVPERLIGVSALFVAAAEGTAASARPGGQLVQVDYLRVMFVPELSLVEVPAFSGSEETLWLEDAATGEVLVPEGDVLEMRSRFAQTAAAIASGAWDAAESIDRGRLDQVLDQLEQKPATIKEN